MKNKKVISIINIVYIVLSGLGLIGYWAFFNARDTLFLNLFIVGFFFYLPALTFTIFAHPITCAVFTVFKLRKKEKPIEAIMSFIISTPIAYSYIHLIHIKGLILSI